MTDPDPHYLQRFVNAQDEIFDTVLAELRAGTKQSHWMWFIFPQLAALGQSAMAKYYGLASMEEARAYLEHPLLGARLRKCIEALLTWAGERGAEQILGPIDAVKLRSCLTLFDRAAPGGLFARGLGAFFHGGPDERTLALLAPTR